MLPFFKIFSLGVRIFSRPVVNYVKTLHKNNFKTIGPISKLFVALGNKQYKLEIFVNRKLMNLKTDSDMFLKPLSTEIALERGIEFFYEVIFYSVIITITLFEMHKAHVSAEASKVKQEQIFQSVEDRLEAAGNKIAEIELGQKNIYSSLDERLKGIALSLEKVLAETEKYEERDAAIKENLLTLHLMQSELKNKIEQLK